MDEQSSHSNSAVEFLTGHQLVFQARVWERALNEDLNLSITVSTFSSGPVGRLFFLSLTRVFSFVFVASLRFSSLALGGC